MFHIILLTFCFVFSLEAGHAQSSAMSPGGHLEAKTLRNKLSARISTIQEQAIDMQKRVKEVESTQSKISKCVKKGKIYKDGDCLGAELVSKNEKHKIKNSAGGCPGSKTYKLPKSVSKDMLSGTFKLDFEKAGTHNFNVVKGKKSNHIIYELVDPAGWLGTPDYCGVYLEYDGNRKLDITCHDLSGAKFCNQNSIKHFNYTMFEVKLSK